MFHRNSKEKNLSNDPKNTLVKDVSKLMTMVAELQRKVFLPQSCWYCMIPRSEGEHTVGTRKKWGENRC